MLVKEREILPSGRHLELPREILQGGIFPRGNFVARRGVARDLTKFVKQHKEESLIAFSSSPPFLRQLTNSFSSAVELQLAIIEFFFESPAIMISPTISHVLKITNHNSLISSRLYIVNRYVETKGSNEIFRAFEAKGNKESICERYPCNFRKHMTLIVLLFGN